MPIEIWGNIIEEVPDLVNITAKRGKKYRVLTYGDAGLALVLSPDKTDFGWKALFVDIPEYPVPPEMKEKLMWSSSGYKFNQLEYPEQKDIVVNGKFISEYTGYYIMNSTERRSDFYSPLYISSYIIHDYTYMAYDISILGDVWTFLIEEIHPENMRSGYGYAGDKYKIEEIWFDPMTMKAKFKFALYTPELEPFLTKSGVLDTAKLENKGINILFYGYAYLPYCQFGEVEFQRKYYKIKRGRPQILKIKYVKRTRGARVWVSGNSIEIDMND